MTRMDRLSTIVTGAAAGQGRHVAARFAREGAGVILVDLDEQEGMAASEAIIAAGGSARFVRADVSSPPDWEGIVAAATDAFGGVDVLYNNAALFSPDDGGVRDLTVDTWDRVMAVNVRSVFLGAKHVVDSMRDRGGGSIINIASIRAWYGTSAPQDAYAASKGAVVGLTKSLAVELAPERIRVNAICPGTIDTAMAPLPDDVARQERIARYPLGRFGSVDDVAGGAVHLACNESAWTTGVILPIDGGASVYYV